MQILFFLKQRLKLKCLQSGNHQKFEHLPGTISTLKKYQSFFQMTFQDIDFFFPPFIFFLQHRCYFNKRGKKRAFLYRRGNPRGGKLDLHKASFEIKIRPFRINEESDKTRERIYRGRHQPLSWQPAAGGGCCLPTSCGAGDAKFTPSSHSVGGQAPRSPGSLLALKSMNLLML